MEGNEGDTDRQTEREMEGEKERSEFVCLCVRECGYRRREEKVEDVRRGK